MSDSDLEDFIDSVCRQSHLRVEDDFGGGYVRLRSDEAERRQAAHDIRSTEDIVIELLRNARDAHAHSIFLAVNREGSARTLVVLDDGEGIPRAMHERVFEPRVTSKLDTMHFDTWGVHGRGMALYSISQNAKCAYIVASERTLGCALCVTTDLTALSERTDQSTVPQVVLNEAGSYILRGPKNIIRTACEFSLASRDECSVYVGSTIEIAATLYAFGLSSLSSYMRTFTSDPSLIPVCKRLSIAATPQDFSRIANSIGLVLSERSARRILDGEIAPLSSLSDLIRDGVKTSGSDAKLGSSQCGSIADGSLSPASSASSVRQKFSDARGLKLCDEDKDLLACAIAKPFEDIASRYYLESHVTPQVQVRSDGIHVVIPVEKMR